MEHRLLSDVYTFFVLSGKDPRFAPEAYGFLLTALDFHRTKSGREGHLEAPELIEAVCDLAALKFGPMAKVVFADWGITETINIGEIVYNFISMGVLTKTDDDTLEQFRLEKTIDELLNSEEIYQINKKMIKKFIDA